MMLPTWNQAKKEDVFGRDAEHPILFNFSEEENYDYLFDNVEGFYGDNQLSLFDENVENLPSKKSDSEDEYFDKYLKSFGKPHYSRCDYSCNLKDKERELYSS
jgi:hypothetical protein